MIETDDLYVWPYGSPGYSLCYILVKGTDIMYCFTMSETWYKADYYEGYYENEKLRYTDDDAEYIFTDEFWKAFAQTVKFVGNADEDFKSGECINCTIASYHGRKGYIPISSYDESRYIILDMDIDDDEVKVSVKIPYVEEWYAGGSYDRDTICEGFEAFLQNNGGEFGFLVIDDFGQGEPTMFYNSALYKYAGGDEVTLIHDFADTFAGLSEDWWMSMSTDPDRTHLLFASGAPDGDEIRVVDLKTFEITDEVWVAYDMDTDEFTQGTVNGVDVGGETAWTKCNEWHSTCNVWLLGRGNVEEIDFGAAWSEYNNRG